MKISLVINSLGAGGAERSAVELANELQRGGHTVTIHTFRDVPPFFSPDPAVRIDCTEIWTGARGPAGKVAALPRAVRILRESIVRAAPDRVIAFMDQANLLTLWALRRSSVPCIVSERVYPAYSSLFTSPLTLPVRPLLRPARERLYRRAAAVVVQTERARGYFSRALAARIEVIPNPIYPPAERGPDPEIPPAAVVAIGRLDPQKRFDLLVRAFAAAAAERPEWRLVIFGDGPERARIERAARESGAADRIILPGVTGAPRAALRRARIFALTSDYEGFPGALCEAMAEGCACLATDCPAGPTELISDGVNGLLSPVGDPARFAERLGLLMDDAGLRERLGAQARGITEALDPKRISERWRSLLERATTP